jgi:hypothetical protein
MGQIPQPLRTAMIGGSTVPSVEVLIPYQESDAWRRSALAHLSGLYAGSFSWFPTVRIIESDEQPFPKAKLLNRAALESKADILVFNDADSLVGTRQVFAAVFSAHNKPGAVHAFDLYRCLTRAAVEGIHYWRDAFDLPEGAFESHLTTSGSHGCYAIRRECFLECGGYDERFAGWGYEDLAQEIVYQSYWPSRRVPGELIHLWHPRAKENPGNLLLWREYQEIARMIEGGQISRGYLNDFRRDFDLHRAASNSTV